MNAKRIRQHMLSGPLCGGKISVSKPEAKSAAKRMQRQTGCRIDPYRCSRCGRWHIGNRRP